MKTISIVAVLIENIKTDQTLLTETETKIEEVKEAKRAVADRLKDYRRDVSTMLKYASDEEVNQLEELGFDFSEQERGLNAVASLAFDLIAKAKDNKLTNDALHQAYVATFKNGEDTLNYTEFNIKCRPLFNSQRLLRKKNGNPKSSREDIISLNGRVIQKTEVSKDKANNGK